MLTSKNIVSRFFAILIYCHMSKF
jgi:hypothetical protein